MVLLRCWKCISLFIHLQTLVLLLGVCETQAFPISLNKYIPRFLKKSRNYNSYYRTLQQSGYVKIIFPEAIDQQYQNAFVNSANFWNIVIEGSGIDPITLNGDLSVKPSCGVENDYTFEEGTLIDGLFILAEVISIDGGGGTLGRATSCFFLDDMPVIGYMQFDVADLQNLANNGGLEAVIKHEMGHVIGIGTLWSRNNLVQSPCTQFNPCNTDPEYLGINGNEGHADLGGQGNILVANQNGPGTANAHWRESTYQTELMTGFLSSGFNALSIMSVKSLLDIGYEVDLATAENYQIPGVTTASPTAPPTIKPGSCNGRCDEPYDPESLFCYCDTGCVAAGDCCEDYQIVCVTPPPEETNRPTATPTAFPTVSPTFEIDLGDDSVDIPTNDTETDLRKINASLAGSLTLTVLFITLSIFLVSILAFVVIKTRRRALMQLRTYSQKRQTQEALPANVQHYEIKAEYPPYI